MLTIRRDNQIHREEGGWFTARWHFSFGDYRDPENDGFGAMRVFNDDRLIPGAIWPLHPHKDIEGITYVVEGSFRHEDSVGGPPGPLPAGSVQRMTLGSGAYHSEQNASADQPMRFIQIWILPNAADLPPEVEQQVFTKQDRTDNLLKVVGAQSGQSMVKVHQDAGIHVAHLNPRTEVTHRLEAGRGAYAYLLDGEATFNGEPASTGDAVEATDQDSLHIRATAPSELILVDVPLDFKRVGVWAGRS